MAELVLEVHVLHESRGEGHPGRLHLLIEVKPGFDKLADSGECFPDAFIDNNETEGARKGLVKLVKRALQPCGPPIDTVHGVDRPSMDVGDRGIIAGGGRGNCDPGSSKISHLIHILSHLATYLQKPI